MPAILGLQRGFFNVQVGGRWGQMWLPETTAMRNLPPICEAYDFLKSKGLSGDAVIRQLVRRYLPFRVIKGGHLVGRTMVTGLIGARGSGKSCNGAMITIFDYLLRGVRCWSNMQIRVKVKYRDCEAVFQTLDLDELAVTNVDLTLQEGCCFLDEVNIIFAEARRSMSRRNLTFTNMIQQLRHRKLDLVYTTQLDTFLDERLRWQTDAYIICKDASLTPAGREYGAKVGEYSFLDTYDYSGIFTGDRYFRGDFPIWSGVTWIKPFWHTYNTFAMQGVASGQPDVTFQIGESEKLRELKLRNQKALEIVQTLKGLDLTSITDEDLWGLASVSDPGQRMSIGRELAELGMSKKRNGKGGYTYFPR